MKRPPTDEASALRLLHRELQDRGVVLDRRSLLRLSMAGGVSALLAGCDVTDTDGMQTVLRRISRFNDGAQAALLRPGLRAPEYTPAQLTKPFRFNAFYSEASVPEIDEATWRLEVGGRVQKAGAWTLDEVRALPVVTEITRLICIEGWSAIGQWSGVPLSHFLRHVGADLSARYVAFRCADGYFTSIDMESAMHPQTLLAHGFAGATRLPDEFGFPLRLRIPIKLGFKNPKHLVGLTVTNEFTSGYWEDLHGYNWFGGL